MKMKGEINKKKLEINFKETNNIKFEKFKILRGIFSIFILLIFINISSISHSFLMKYSMNNMEMQDSLMDVEMHLKLDLIDKGKYKCCLKEPCSYCLLENIEKTEYFDGKKLECECLVEIMEGKSPCPECVGEILEGGGNKYIAQYFATAIAEKTGNVEVIKKIISEKYNISIERQI